MNARQSFAKFMLDILVLMTPIYSIEKINENYVTQ